MVKKLLLMRHAQAEPAGGHIRDKERSLTPTGFQQASRMGFYLHQSGIVPELIVCSDAVRAFQTAARLKEQFAMEEGDVLEEPDFYEASVRQLLERTNQLPDNVHQVMLIAHNPGISYLCEYLTGEGMNIFDPGSVGIMQFQVGSWKEISQKTGDFLQYLSPETIQ